KTRSIINDRSPISITSPARARRWRASPSNTSGCPLKCRSNRRACKPARRNLGAERASVFDEGVIRIAIEPALASFTGRDYRMATRFRMSSGVAIGRAVAAQRRPAVLTGSQVDPLRFDLDALFAHVSLRVLDGGNGLNVLAGRRCRHDVILHSVSVRCTNEIAIEPSPTAEATRLTLPPRTSPTANTPGRLVSSRWGGRSRGQRAATRSSRVRSGPVLMNPFAS